MPRDEVSLTGGLSLSGPTGGLAKGMPLKASVAIRSAPMMEPEAMVTVGAALFSITFVGGSGGAAATRPSRAAAMKVVIPFMMSGWCGGKETAPEERREELGRNGQDPLAEPLCRRRGKGREAMSYSNFSSSWRSASESIPPKSVHQEVNGERLASMVQHYGAHQLSAGGMHGLRIGTGDHTTAWAYGQVGQASGSSVGKSPLPAPFARTGGLWGASGSGSRENKAGKQAGESGTCR